MSVGECSCACAREHTDMAERITSLNVTDSYHGSSAQVAFLPCYFRPPHKHHFQSTGMVSCSIKGSRSTAFNTQSNSVDQEHGSGWISTSTKGLVGQSAAGSGRWGFFQAAVAAVGQGNADPEKCLVSSITDHSASSPNFYHMNDKVRKPGPTPGWWGRTDLIFAEVSLLHFIFAFSSTKCPVSLWSPILLNKEKELLQSWRS